MRSIALTTPLLLPLQHCLRTHSSRPPHRSRARQLDDVRHSLSSRHQPGRLVTVRLSFSALRGGHLHRTTVRNVANYTGLKLPEVLTWAGGVRVVYTEDQLPHIDRESSLSADLSRGLHLLNNKLQVRTSHARTLARSHVHARRFSSSR